MPPQSQISPSGLIAVVPVVRITAQLKKTLKSRTIAAATLATYDEHFKSIMASYPDPYPIHSQAYLDPRLLTAACALQTVRFFLYRHNLTSAARPGDRRDALDRCVSAAKDTAHYISRSMQNSTSTGPPGYYPSTHMESWAKRLRTMSPAFFCAHLWRCQLVLCLRGEYGAALTLIQASAAVGDMRKNNIACGRYLSFFLSRLIERLRAGATQQQLELDEEMLAYASGDIQGCAEEAWSWVGSETGASLNVKSENGHFSPGLGEQQRAQAGDEQHHPSMQLTERERKEWGGWEHIQHTLTQLMHEQRPLHSRAHSQSHSRAHSQSQAPPLAPPQQSTPQQVYGPPPPPPPNPAAQYPPPPLQPSADQYPPHGQAFIRHPILHPPHGQAHPHPHAHQPDGQAHPHPHAHQYAHQHTLAPQPAMGPLNPSVSPAPTSHSGTGSGSGGASASGSRISIKDIM